jgi:hypothetical protein
VSWADDLLWLRGQSLQAVLSATGAAQGRREPVTGYQSLQNLDVIEAPNGVRIYLRGNDVALIYAGEAALPDDADEADLVAVVGSEGEFLRSRQGKRAALHVVAEQGVAWSEQDGVVAFVELFPPTRLEDYRRDIYLEPPQFVQ